MAQLLDMPESAKKVLGGKGKKMHTHEMHLKRLEGGKILARHTLADKHGNPPTDGQRSEREYALNDPKELAAHVAEHMGAMPDEDEENDAA